jgi:alkylhydroperoxidase/carboxymuconolactone decarboxylase family protein YurZ
MRTAANLINGCGDNGIRGCLRGAPQPPPRAHHGKEHAMTTPANVEVDDATKDALNGLALGDLEVLESALELREAWQERSGLDPRAFSLVKIAALIALDAPPASYLWQISNALDAGATPAEILGVMRAIAPQVGGPRVVAAAPEIMVALGLSLPPGGDFD